MRIRVEGVKPLNLDERMGLVGWRTRYLMADDKIRARMAALVGYTPPVAAPIATAPPAPEMPIITREALGQAVAEETPIPDVLAFVLDRWPAFPLEAQLRAYGELASGRFGPLEVIEPSEPRRYRAVGAEVDAVPLSLLEYRSTIEVSP